MALLFDDSEKLKEAVGKEAAEVIAHVLERQDEQYKQELATRADLMAMKAELQVEIATVRGELKAEVRDAKSEIIKWMAGLLIVQGGSIAALVKLL
ncbi:hypothetical protein [Desulfovibrio sp. JC010]|uniref:hypothetical protein n=1 Tax=Desulfovibrio sp. JC010 TaxID=2593641 RepID=UPI0013D11C79|nr:hypothetical protein [Desulfovibrio sp. JC010]NDV27620.1 hypothetical protein [Desulfovibrio sp. JC010]